MPDMTPQEEAISPQLTEQHRALIAGLGRFERDSLAKYVNPGNIEVIQVWIGDDAAIERTLFWDRGASSTIQPGGGLGLWTGPPRP